MKNGFLIGAAALFNFILKSLNPIYTNIYMYLFLARVESRYVNNSVNSIWKCSVKCEQLWQVIFRKFCLTFSRKLYCTHYISILKLHAQLLRVQELLHQITPENTFKKIKNDNEIKKWFLGLSRWIKKTFNIPPVEFI